MLQNQLFGLNIPVMDLTSNLSTIAFCLVVNIKVYCFFSPIVYLALLTGKAILSTARQSSLCHKASVTLTVPDLDSYLIRLGMCLPLY